LERCGVGALGILPILALALVVVGGGCSHGTCPQLSAEVGDQDSNLPGRLVPEPADEIAFLYEQDSMRSFELLLTEEDLATLDADPRAEEYVPGTLVFEGVHYPVAVRYKGSYGSWLGCTDGPAGEGTARSCPKLNLKVSFNEYDPEYRFFGVKKLLFHAMNKDSSLMRERLGYWLFRQMGVPAPRATHVRLFINGSYSGVYVNVEYVDGRFTRSRFRDGEGNLYKGVWPARSLWQPEADRERWLSRLRTNEHDNPSVDKALDFTAAVTGWDVNGREAGVLDWMSVPNTMRHLAVDRTIRHDDGPMHWWCSETRCTNHNYYFYVEEWSERVWLIPWDLDKAFVYRPEGVPSNFWTEIVYEWDDHDVACQIHEAAVPAASPQMPPSCDRLTNTLGSFFHEEYDTAVAELVDGPFSAEVVEGMLASWEEQIAPAVEEAHEAEDEQLSYDDWQSKLTSLRGKIDGLRLRAEAAADR
jgi:hypothetical protein